MKIEFQNMIPYPISKDQLNEFSLWGKSFEINANEKIILKAQSGKGKSTFIHILFGLRNDYSGNLFINDKNIQDLNSKEWSDFRKTKISIVFQDLQLFDDLTAWENIQIKNDLCKHFDSFKIEQLIDRMGMSPFKNQLAKTLSYGQKQRIAIIRALAQPFEIILLDEPFSHLDFENEKIAFEIILEEVQNNQAGLILTSLNENQNFTFDRELLL